MGEAENRQTVERLFQALNEFDFGPFRDQYHEDSVVEFPQSGERIVGGRAAGRCTGRSPDGRVSPTVTSPSSRPPSTTPRGRLARVFIYELREGKIARATAYWAQPFEAAGWRAEWVEPMDG
jgi:ketosteroid isomerase-like protein